MQYRIDICSLAANAFAEALKRDPGKRLLTFGVIEAYGTAVQSVLRDAGFGSYLALYRDLTDAFFRDHSHFFLPAADMSGIYGIYLADGADRQSLIAHYRGTLPLALLKAFTHPGPVRVLFRS